MAVNSIPSDNIGGNIVSPTADGKVKVQTAKGKTRVLTQDQFEKSILKNAENIKAGKDFEIKKSNTTAKILGLVVAAATITAGIIFRKDIGKFIKGLKKPSFAELRKQVTARNEVLKANGLSKKDYKAMKAYAAPDAKITDKVPAWARDKETCQRYTTMVELQMKKRLDLAAQAVEASAKTAETTAKAAETTTKVAEVPAKA